MKQAKRNAWAYAFISPFYLLYAVFGLPLGRLSDRTARRRILAGGVFVWSLLTAASGMARTFSQLVVARPGGHLDPSYLVELVQSRGRPADRVTAE
jgi:MFS family permease